MEWLTLGLEGMVMVAVSTALIYAALIAYTRVSGLRSFSKMSSFDFATTIAMGSIIASTAVMKDPPVVQGVVALGTIFVLQFVVAQLRRRTSIGSTIFDNEALLLMDGDGFVEENMNKARVTREDIWAKLRAANVHDLSEVRAIVLEMTGDVSVLHASDPDRTFDPAILDGVRDASEKAPPRREPSRRFAFEAEDRVR